MAISFQLIKIGLIGSVLLFFNSAQVCLADSKDKDLEVYMGGKKYRSVAEYREIQKRLFREESNESTSTSDETANREVDHTYVRSYLEMMLEKFSDDEITLFLRELKQEKAHLFTPALGPPSPQTQYDLGLSQMHKMIRDHAETHGEDIGLEFDPKKVKTIYISSNKSSAPKRTLPKTNTQMQISERTLNGLGYRNMRSIIEEFKKRDAGPLSKKYYKLETVTIQGIMEVLQ